MSVSGLLLQVSTSTRSQMLHAWVRVARVTPRGRGLLRDECVCLCVCVCVCVCSIFNGFVITYPAMGRGWRWINRYAMKGQTGFVCMCVCVWVHAGLPGVPDQLALMAVHCLSLRGCAYARRAERLHESMCLCVCMCVMCCTGSCPLPGSYTVWPQTSSVTTRHRLTTLVTLTSRLWLTSLTKCSGTCVRCVGTCTCVCAHPHTTRHASLSFCCACCAAAHSSTVQLTC